MDHGKKQEAEQRETAGQLWRHVYTEPFADWVELAASLVEQRLRLSIAYPKLRPFLLGQAGECGSMVHYFGVEPFALVESNYLASLAGLEMDLKNKKKRLLIGADGGRFVEPRPRPAGRPQQGTVNDNGDIRLSTVLGPRVQNMLSNLLPQGTGPRPVRATYQAPTSRHRNSEDDESGSEGSHSPQALSQASVPVEESLELSDLSMSDSGERQDQDHDDDGEEAEEGEEEKKATSSSSSGLAGIDFNSLLGDPDTPERPAESAQSKRKVSGKKDLVTEPLHVLTPLLRKWGAWVPKLHSLLQQQPLLRTTLVRQFEKHHLVISFDSETRSCYSTTTGQGQGQGPGNTEPRRAYVMQDLPLRHCAWICTHQHAGPHKKQHLLVMKLSFRV